MKNAWIFFVGIPLIGFRADNGGEFMNMKMDELTSKLGISVKCGPTYSLLSNGSNKQNHTSADMTIKKMWEEKKFPTNDSIVKACKHNTTVNMLGYSPLQLVTGKAVALLGLSM